MENSGRNDFPIEPVIILRCACCGLPFACIVDSQLVIESRHGGEVHVNTISLAGLAAVGSVVPPVLKQVERDTEA